MQITYLQVQALKSTSLCHQIASTVTAIAISAVGLGSCTPNSTRSSPATSPQIQISDTSTNASTDELKIVTSTLPVTDFTQAVVGDRAEVIYLLPTNVGPHDYQAKPGDVRLLAEADVLVKNGLGIDAYLDHLVDNANNSDLQVIDTSEGVGLIANEAVEEHAEANHPEPDHPENHHPEETMTGNETEGHRHEGEFNPHIWLDPQRAIQQVENIRDGLIATDPDGKAVYTANASTYIDQLQALDQAIATILQPYAGKTFVTYHNFASYFAQRYDLHAEYLVGVPEDNPSPIDVQRVLNAAKASDLKTLLTEPQAVGNPFAALARDLDVRVSSFDPMETSGSEGIEPNYYFTVMHQNLENIKQAFGAVQ